MNGEILEFDLTTSHNSVTFDRVLDYFKSTPIRRPDQGYAFFAGREMSPSEIQNPEVLRGLWSLIFQIIQYSSVEYKCFLFPEFWDVVYWGPGMSMDVHVDNGKGLEQRHFTSITYLDSDYEGGETYLPEHNRVITPTKGKTVMFPSDYPHGVHEITKGERHTFAAWYTKDPNFCMYFN